MPGMSSTRNGKFLSLEQKLEVCKLVESSESFRKIAGILKYPPQRTSAEKLCVTHEYVEQPFFTKMDGKASNNAFDSAEKALIFSTIYCLLRVVIPCKY
ncbi:hypothetical protein T4D_14928 [Trichinella pseudospiralis]|uniref:HTH psq-type domain-containing protein n=1 Tax=Trichinella pseudospiralis TaxID=6337 RepID=A0A0V1FH11_TRIPS|nr:hypothetical protein T4D_14928 [Trichinella pseudospiralis]